MDTSEQLKKAVIQYIEAYNNFDIEGMLKNLHENIIFENYSNGDLTLQTQGLTQFRHQAENSKGFFITREQKYTSLQISDNIVHLNIDYTATLAQDLSDTLQQGDTIHLQGTSDFHFHQNKIIKIEDRS